MEDRTKELWEGVPEWHYAPPLEVANETGWRGFLVSRTMGAVLALACVLGLIGIFSAHPFASSSISERVADQLGRPAACTVVGAAVTADSHSTIHRCVVGGMNRSSARCFAVSGRDIRQLSGRRELGC